jgi:hypothetical protein
MAAMFEPHVGARVVVARELATVRYIGPVAQQAGTWIGLEWDDASRGKHDGSTGGVKYFSCVGGQSAGSFVRAEKVNFGSSLAKALVARYSNECAEGADPARAEDMFVQTASHKLLAVEMVGEEQVTQRQAQLQLLTRARVVKAFLSHLVRGGAGGAAPDSGAQHPVPAKGAQLGAHTPPTRPSCAEAAAARRRRDRPRGCGSWCPTSRSWTSRTTCSRAGPSPWPCAAPCPASGCSTCRATASAWSRRPPGAGRSCSCTRWC